MPDDEPEEPEDTAAETPAESSLDPRYEPTPEFPRFRRTPLA